jgi:type I restriction enzyme S subunit
MAIVRIAYGKEDKRAMIGQELGKTGHEPNPDLPDGFQMTELGPLPKEWRVVRLGEILVETNQRVREIEGQDIVVLSITRHFGLISQEEKFKKRVASRNLDNYKVVHRGELVYGFPMDEGVIHFLWQYPVGAVSPVYYTWKLYNSQADAHFLDYLLKTPHLLRIYEMLQSKTVHRRRIVHPKDFINISIPLPPLPEQRAIAHVLRTVQRAKEATEGVIAALKELKKSLMQHLFTYGPVPVTKRERVPLQETELGPIPDHWRVVRLGEVARIKQGKVLPTSSFTRYGYPVYGANGQIGWFSQYTHAEEEVLITCRGATCGTINVSPPKSFITNNAMIVTPMQRDRLQKDYLALALQMADLSSCITGSGQPQITKGKLALIPIPLPPLAEQREIARMLQAVDAKIAAEERRRAALEEVFKALLHALMSGRIRVPHIVGGERSCDSAPDADKLPKSDD